MVFVVGNSDLCPTLIKHPPGNNIACEEFSRTARKICGEIIFREFFHCSNYDEY